MEAADIFQKVVPFKGQLLTMLCCQYKILFQRVIKVCSSFLPQRFFSPYHSLFYYLKLYNFWKKISFYLTIHLENIFKDLLSSNKIIPNPHFISNIVEIPSKRLSIKSLPHRRNNFLFLFFH